MLRRPGAPPYAALVEGAIRDDARTFMCSTPDARGGRTTVWPVRPAGLRAAWRVLFGVYEPNMVVYRHPPGTFKKAQAEDA